MQTLKEGNAYDGLVLIALVRRGKPEDAHPGKPTPRFVFNVMIKGIEKPIITVRCPSLGAFMLQPVLAAHGLTHRRRAADANTGFELVSTPEADAAMRARALSHLPNAAESYAQVATEDLPAQAGYQAPVEEAPEAPAAPEASAAPAAAPAADSAAAAAAAAASAAAPAPTAAAAGLSQSELMCRIRNPLHLRVLHDRKVRSCSPRGSAAPRRSRLAPRRRFTRPCSLHGSCGPM